MKDYTVQILCITLLLSSVRCHLFFSPGPPGPGFPYLQPGFDFGFRGSRPPLQQAQPVVFNADTVAHYPQWPIFPLRPTPIQVYRLPDQTVIVPLKTFSGFPAFIERLVQRIQTYYSVYNPVESLTRPPPDDAPTTNKSIGSNGTVQSVQIMTSNSSQDESTVVGQVTVTTSKTSIKNKVPTLTIYEIQPSEGTTLPTTTTSPEDEDTTIPPDIETTEEPNFISPENASVAAKASSGFRYENFPLEHFFYKRPSMRRS